jgi:hypothetical protein
LQTLSSQVAIERRASVVSAAEVPGFTPSTIPQRAKKPERTLDADLL